MSEPRRPETIKGYSHPTNFNYSKNSRYKIFTEGIKVKNMSKCSSTESGNQYSQFEENITPENITPEQN